MNRNCKNYIKKFVNMCKEVTKILECMNYYIYFIYILCYIDIYFFASYCELIFL